MGLRNPILEINEDVPLFALAKLVAFGCARSARTFQSVVASKSNRWLANPASSIDRFKSSRITIVRQSPLEAAKKPNSQVY